MHRSSPGHPQGCPQETAFRRHGRKVSGAEDPGPGSDRTRKGASDEMNCPFCREADSRVVDSRATDDGTAIRRRRQCSACGRRFTTMESPSLMIVKRSGASEAFSRSKVISGVRKACQGRPVSDDDLAVLAQRVEDGIRQGGSAEVPSGEVGLAILGPLRDLDEVAYLRFASVYRDFSSLADFEKEIGTLRNERSPGPRPATNDSHDN